MSRKLIRCLAVGAISSVLALPALADDPPVPPAPPRLNDLLLGQIKAPTLDQARDQALQFLKSTPQGQNRWQTAQAIWAPSDVRTLLDRTIDTFVLADDNIAQFVKSVRAQPSTLLLETPLLKDPSRPAYVRNNLTLFLARALAHQRLHEDSLALLRTLTPESLIDPATFYFYRAVCENKLRLKDDGLLSTHRLLSTMQQDAPERYLVVATLMQDEMLKWEDQDLGDVARRMEEIEARLGNARGGQKTQEKHKEVVALLDKIIKDLEDQC
jgi:hypothetical protein